MDSFILFTGNANIPLAEKIAKSLNITLGKARVGQFSDGELDIEILENVRGKEIFVLQSTCQPSSKNLMELLLIADALKRASAARITAVMPYYGCARQDRRIRSIRVPITAKVVADMLATAGIDRILTLDLHAEQIQGFFSIPVDNLYATPLFLKDIRIKKLTNIVVVSPDVGGVARARALVKYLPNVELVIIDKRRSKPNQAEVMHVIGEVQDRHCIIIDDIIDTAGTLRMAAEALKAHGAQSVSAYVTHPVLSGPAIENIEKSDLQELVVTDSIPLSDSAKQCFRIRVLSISEMLAKAMQSIIQSSSLKTVWSNLIEDDCRL